LNPPKADEPGGNTADKSAEIPADKGFMSLRRIDAPKARKYSIGA